MKTLVSVAVTCTFFLVVASVGQFPAPGQAQTIAAMSSRGVLTGELVASKTAGNQFRLVGHRGWFTAPPGVFVEELDGKPVQVEIGRDRRVLDITTMPIRNEPITRTYENISGELIVRDPVLRTFTFPGERNVYAAPPGVDIRPYSGRMVEVQLDEHGKVMTIAVTESTTGVPLTANCAFDGGSFADGAALCQSGTQLVCDRGQWRDLGRPCASAGTDLSGATGSSAGDLHRAGQRALSAWRSCFLGGASLAHGSSVCREGTTFRCVDGNWVKLGTACS
jgi:hypothetical protein